MTPELESLIEAIPGEDGWHEQDNRDTYMDVAQMLITQRGMTELDVIDVLTSLFWAAVECYGA